MRTGRWNGAVGGQRKPKEASIRVEAMGATETNTVRAVKTGAGATIEDLYRLPGNQKAELVNGEIVLMRPTGDFPSIAGGRIYASLDQYGRQTRSGRAYPNNAGFR